MSRSGRWFWSVVAAQALFLLGWAAYHEVIRSYAPVILLRTKPVDPRDLLRGDFITLRYEIADVKESVVPGAKVPPAAASAGEKLWVVLEKRGAYHEAVSLVRDEPSQLQPGQVAVRVRRDWGGLRFGIEQFFVPEGQGVVPRFKTLDVEAAVSPTHELYIRRLLIDGKNFP